MDYMTQTLTLMAIFAIFVAIPIIVAIAYIRKSDKEFKKTIENIERQHSQQPQPSPPPTTDYNNPYYYNNNNYYYNDVPSPPPQPTQPIKKTTKKTVNQYPYPLANDALNATLYCPRCMNEYNERNPLMVIAPHDDESEYVLTCSRHHVFKLVPVIIPKEKPVVVENNNERETTESSSETTISTESTPRKRKRKSDENASETQS